MSYQDPRFSKAAYWEWRNKSDPEQRRAVRRLQSKSGFALKSDMRESGFIPFTSNKPVSKKALRKNTKRARKLQEVS